MSKFQYRLHVIGLPHTRSNKEYTACAFTQKLIKFCKMMHDIGHTVYHYGTEGSDVVCTEHVDVVSNEMFDRVYKGIPKNGPYDLEPHEELYTEFMKNTIRGIGERKRPCDFILPFWGVGVKPVCDAHPDLITVEPGIGYPGAFANYRVYESYAWLNCQLGDQQSPSWYHVVIPNFFDLDDFTFNPESRTYTDDPYFLFVGRLMTTKGIDVAIQVCERLGIKLKVAGAVWDKQYETLPPIAEYVGTVGIEERNSLMGGAIATFVPSYYSEPFGGVQVESLLCGTPVITTDWGAFPEVNVHGVTGYRCHTFDDFVNAALNCMEGKILHENCRKRGEEYSLERIAPMYEKYLDDVYKVHTDRGWYSEL